MAAESKRRKLDDAPFRRTASSSAEKKDRAEAPLVGPMIMGVEPKIQQVKNFAVAQAQQEGCMGNFKIVDSPFGNFLVPVIPTRSELSR